jgi:uncharacterized membrane protein YhaH (DUF805 family)
MDKINRNNWWIYILALFGAAAIGCLVTFMIGGKFSINMYFRYLGLAGFSALLVYYLGYWKNKRKKNSNT